MNAVYNEEDSLETTSINYKEYLSHFDSELSAHLLHEAVDADLSYAWIEKYKEQCKAAVSILSITLGDFTYLWDEVYERVVAVYGIANSTANRNPKRDKSRIAYYFRNFIKRYQDNTEMDTGHFIAHSLGGGLDTNLFPQRRDLNQGRSGEGKQYRKMENYAYKHPGTFVFSRPIYADDTWKPKFLEYGILMNDCTLWTQVFNNNSENL